MKVVIQRVTKASVTIDSKIVGSIKDGLLILLGIINEDTQDDINWLSNKIVNLRIFGDENGVMNKSLTEHKLAPFLMINTIDQERVSVISTKATSACLSRFIYGKADKQWANQF